MTKASLSAVPCAALAVACELLTMPSPLRAQTAPVQATVLSSQSTNGSFGLMISGASPADCRAMAARLTMVPAVALSAVEVQPCSFAVTPSSALANGEHCVAIADFVGTLVRPCLQVTGTQVSLASAGAAVEGAGPDSWTRGACQPCSNAADGSACTRSVRQRRVRLTITNVPSEFASAYELAALPESEAKPNTAAPSDKDFFLLDAPLITPLTLDQEDGGERACLRVYARPFASTAATLLGVACLDTVLPSSVPLAYVNVPSVCEPDYRLRWCADNRTDCTSSSAGSLSGCADFAQTCQSPLDAALPSSPDAAQATTLPDAAQGGASDAATVDAGLAAPLDASSTTKSRAQGGCSVDSRGHGSLASWLALVGAYAYWRVRARRSRSRS